MASPQPQNIASARPGTAGSVDRSGEAEGILHYLARGARLAVLYGRRGSRRRDLICNWVLPRARELRIDAYYGDCDPDLPLTVRSLDRELPIEEALRNRGLVFLGSIQRHIAIPDRERQRRLADLLGAVESGALPGSMVLLIPERNLGQLLALQSSAPSLMANVLEIATVPFLDSLRSWSGSGVTYAPEALEVLNRGLGQGYEGDGVELARAVHQGFLRFKDSGGTVTERDCAQIGGIPGALEEFCEAQLVQAAERFGPPGRKAVDTILQEVAGALAESTTPDLDDLPFRLDIDQAFFDTIFQWLVRDAQLLREEGSRRFELVPAELRRGLEERVARTRRDAEHASALLQEGVRTWNTLGVGLPPRRLQEIEAVRESLRAGTEEAGLMVRSLLRSESAPPLERIRYWLRRTRSRQREVSLAIEAVFSDRAEARNRAAQMLDGYSEPEARSQLHRLAIEDPDAAVRGAALASLGSMDAREFCPLISQEALEIESPYQQNAVAALRLFPDSHTTNLLRDLVADSGQPEPIKAEAIDTLAHISTSESVRTLVDIGLRHSDPGSRRHASAALAGIESADRLAEAVALIRDTPVLAQPAGSAGAWRAVGASVLGVLFVLAAVVALIAVGSVLVVIGPLLLALSPVAMLVVTRLLIVRQRKDIAGFAGGKLRPGFSQRMRRAILLTLLTLDLPYFFFLHGLARLLTGRLRRAVLLFATECLGVICFFLGYYYFSGSDFVPAFPGAVSQVLMIWYIGVGALLLVGSFVWDVGEMVDEVVLCRRRIQRDRRTSLYVAILHNRWVAGYVLKTAVNGSRREIFWARRLVRTAGSSMPVEALVEALAAPQRRPGYLLRVLQRQKAREGMVAALASTYRGARPRLRRWIVDVLAGSPDERSLEQLTTFRPDLDGYGRLRLSVAVWHHRFILWPKSLLFAGAILLPILVCAPFEVHSTFEDPLHPLLRILESPAAVAALEEKKFVAYSEVLARVYPGKHLDVLKKLFLEPGSKSRGESIARSLGVAACQEELEADKRVSLARFLADGLRKGRTEIGLALSPIQSDEQRCGLDEASRQELAKAGADLLAGSASEKEVAGLAILALDTARHPSAVAPLRDFVLRLPQAAGPGYSKVADQNGIGHADPWDDLRHRALLALSANGSPESVQALDEIATNKRVAKPVRAEAARMNLDILKQPLDHGDYQKAYDEGKKLLEVDLQGQPRYQLLTLLGRAAKHLGLDRSKTQFLNEAIGYLENAQKIAPLDADARGDLAETYAHRGERFRDLGNIAAGRRDAEQAIRVDPEYAGGYEVRASLLQRDHQYAASLRDSLTAIEKDPSYYWGYDLARDAYLGPLDSQKDAGVRRKVITDVVNQFENLVQRFPDVVWPRRELTFIYHEYLIELDPDRALARSYQVNAEVEQQFGDRLQESEKLSLDEDFLESNLSVGNLEYVVKQGPELDKKLPQAQDDDRLGVELVTYAAFVLKQDTQGALAQLGKIEDHLKRMPQAEGVGTWVYRGTLYYLRSRRPAPAALAPLIQLIEAANAEKHPKDLLALIPANRLALQAPGSGRTH